MSETEILLLLRSFWSPALDAVFLFSHAIGTLPFFVVLVTPVILRHMARGERGEARLWLLLGVTTYALQEGLKQLVARPRPKLWSQLLALDSFAFPSGHALASATFYPLLGWALTRRGPGRRIGVGLGIALALFVGLGRLYLGVHWPSDVLAGWALGAAQATTAIAWLRARRARDS